MWFYETTGRKGMMFGSCGKKSPLLKSLLNEELWFYGAAGSFL